MQAKLTLTIDQDVVAKAKSYAQRRRRSISSLVEDYLKTVSEADAMISDDSGVGAPLTESVAGIFKEEYNGQNYKEILSEALLERYA